MIAVIFLIAMFSSILLSLMGALPFWASGAIVLTSLAGLCFSAVLDQQLRRKIRRRSRQLQARWGMRTTHLGGLPVPLDTPAVLFLLHDHLRLETEFDYWKIPLSELKKILIVSSENIRRLPDRQLGELLATGNIRSFSSLREKIRHHDKAVRGHGILMIAYKTEKNDPRLLILATLLRPATLNGYFAAGGLPADIFSRFEANGKPVRPVV